MADTSTASLTGALPERRRLRAARPTASAAFQCQRPRGATGRSNAFRTPRRSLVGSSKSFDRPTTGGKDGVRLAWILDDRGEALDVLSRQLLELEHVVVEELDVNLLAADVLEHPCELPDGVLAMVSFPRRLGKELILNRLKDGLTSLERSPVPIPSEVRRIE